MDVVSPEISFGNFVEKLCIFNTFLKPFDSRPLFPKGFLLELFEGVLFFKGGLQGMKKGTGVIRLTSMNHFYPPF